jgi:hypothetical protein
MDQQIEELKQLVRQNIELTKDTNKIVHGMRNAGRIKSLLMFALLAIGIGLSLYSYFYFVAPRIEQIQSAYEQNIGPIQSMWEKINGFINASPTSTPSAAQ